MVAKAQEQTRAEKVIKQARKVANHPVANVTENVELIGEMQKLLTLIREMDAENSARWNA